jgi:hypothetical protein
MNIKCESNYKSTAPEKEFDNELSDFITTSGLKNRSINIDGKTISTNDYFGQMKNGLVGKSHEKL